MPRRTFRPFVLLATLAGLLIGISGDRVDHPPAALAQGSEVFTAVIPGKVYSGIPSHPGLADADPTNGTNGYCVKVANEGHASIGTNFGFQVVNGVILSTSFFNNGSAETTDDVYCVVATATRIESETLPRPDMVITWDYLTDGAVAQATLAVQVVTVQLMPKDGVVRGVAQTCTFGWDPTFLTGEDSNDPQVLPNPLDIVRVDDWAVSPPATNVGVLRHGSEWCFNSTANAPTSDVDIAFTFWATYNVQLTADDHLITESLTDAFDIDNAEAPELRHMTPLDGLGGGGQVDEFPIAPTHVIGAVHAACVIPSDVVDTLSPADINFFSDDGALPSHVSVFYNDGTYGVPDGTLCFSWTSEVPGHQFVSLSYTAGVGGPMNPGVTPKVLFAAWDTNGDGNDLPEEQGAQLSIAWARIDHTRITSGGTFDTAPVTFAEIPIGITFNAADGRYIGGASVTEWVVGRIGNGPLEPLDGVPVRVEIASFCGYIVTDSGPAQVVEATTSGGGISVSVAIDFDGSCGPNNVIRLEFRAKYPPITDEGQKIDLEYVTFRLQYSVPQIAPQVLWIHSTATLSFSFSGDDDCDAEVPQFVRESGQPGAFIPGPGVNVRGPDQAFGTFDACSATVRYESEVPGEVDITANMVGREFTKVHYTLYFLALEDIVLTTAEEQTVSEFGPISAKVRGWFLGDNPSGRPEEKKPDGRVLPADRWILPDDWDKLRGPAEHRSGGSAGVPPIKVTFFMENEGVRNNYKTGVKNGASGFFLADKDVFASDFNINPETRVPSLLGSINRPRILSEWTDAPTKKDVGDGVADLLTWGDLNLTYEECAINVPTGNAHCQVDDIVGRATYYALVDYPVTPKGKFPPIRSNTVSKRFTWEGYKEVTVEDGPVAHEKYVVVHLKDRDGFCDAISINNVLGTRPIEFKVDNGEGIILTAADNPSAIEKDFRRQAWSTTFDTETDLGTPMNQHIAQPTLIDDECQAWIKVSDSLMRPMNVLVSIPGPAIKAPTVRITGLTCGLGGFAVVTNVGDSLVSLAGLAIRSAKSSTTGGAPGIQISDEEHLGLVGHLEPGKSAVITSEQPRFPWVGLSGQSGAFGATGDYARLVWEEETITFAECGGAITQFAFPTPLIDLEGSLLLDVLVTFEATTTVQLMAGWNLISTGDGSLSIEDALGTNAAKLGGIFHWTPDLATWLRYVPDIPADAQTLTELGAGKAYWVLAKEPFTLTIPK
ncbi:MAG: hypothetical protein ACKVVT_03340 [Dehalococcoidia bacterium]